MKKQEKAEMNPIRYKMNRYAIPAFIALILLSFIFVAMIVVFAKAKWLCWIPAGMALGLSVALIVLNAIIVKKEEETELKRWAYLFKKEIPYDGETFETDDPETGINYLLSKKGVKVILPIKAEQVFDEAKENEYFIPWSDTEIALASDNFARRVRLAFAVIDVSKRSVYGDYVPQEYEVHFLPLEEELLAFLRKNGLEYKVSVEWRYILAQPKDAFRQILARGYVRTLIDENGKRVKRENADHLYEN
ncbi:MAG: hypothetical protein J6A46_03885 [Clostridia bacterium]|nr:hypothetical protein [Clostridia bacterium]